MSNTSVDIPATPEETRRTECAYYELHAACGGSWLVMRATEVLIGLVNLPDWLGAKVIVAGPGSRFSPTSALRLCTEPALILCAKSAADPKLRID